MTSVTELAPLDIGPLVLDHDQCGALGTLLGEIISSPTIAATTPLISPILLHKSAVNTGVQDLISSTADRVTIHEYQSFKVITPLAEGIEYRLVTHVEREQKQGSAFGFHAEIRRGETQICMHTQTTLRNLTASELFRLTGAPLREKQKTDIKNWVHSVPINQQLVDRYLKISGDRNPAHHNREFAASLGLAGVLIPGMLIAGAIEPVLKLQHPDSVINEVRLRFMAPALVGSVVNFGVLDRGATNIQGQSRTRIFATDPDDIILFIADIILSKPLDEIQVQEANKCQ